MLMPHPDARACTLRDPNAPLFFACTHLRATPKGTGTCRSDNFCERIAFFQHNLAENSRPEFGKLASIGRFLTRTVTTIARECRSALMKAHRLEASSCQTIKILTCIGVTASVGAAFSWRCSQFWVSSCSWHWPALLAEKATEPHPLLATPSHQRQKLRLSQPNSAHLSPRTAKGRRLWTSAFCVFAPLNGACPC